MTFRNSANEARLQWSLMHIAALLGALAATSLATAPARAFTANENWFSTLSVGTILDAVTSDNGINGNAWTVDAGADSYTNDYYERPTGQQADYTSGNFRAYKFLYQNLDITSGNFAFDSANSIAYFRINLYGTLEGEFSSLAAKPLEYQYRVLFDDSADLIGGYLANSTQPISKLGLAFSGASGTDLTLWRDSNNDVGVDGNGFDATVVVSGDTNNIVQARRGGDGTYVDFAANYGADGLDLASGISFVRFEAIKGDPKDNQNYLWPFEYTLAEAGSPYLAAYGPDGSAVNVSNIYEVDTTQVAAVPVPAGVWLLGSALMGLAGAAIRRKRAM